MRARPAQTRAPVLLPRVLLPTVLLATVVLAGCGAVSTPTSGQPSPGTATTPTTPVRAVARDRPTPAQIVTDPRSTLSAARVAPGPEGYTVRAWWVLTRHGRSVSAIVTSDDRMESPSYARGTYRAWSKGSPPVTKPAPAPGMGDLLSTDVFSLQDGTRAQEGGHDGATLIPFERLMRSVDGAAWERFDVPKTDGQQAYTAGQVVLPNGRLLALLNAWSRDGRHRSSTVWHGLWISDGDDWSSYRPWRPRFFPDLPAGTAPWGPLESIGAAVDPRQTGGGIVWVTTIDRVYVSTDGARTFREIPARP